MPPWLTTGLVGRAPLSPSPRHASFEPVATVELPFLDTTSSLYEVVGEVAVVSTLPTRAKRGGHRKEDRRVAVEYILRRMGMMHPPSCLCFNATLLGLVRCRHRQTVRRNNGSVVGSVACSVLRRPGPYIPSVISLMGLCCRHGLHTGRRQWKFRT